MQKDTMIRKNDEYFSDLKKHAKEYGFYIACDDRSILNCVNAMLLNHGMVGISDTDGKTHFLIDGRRGGNYVLQQVKENVLTLRETFRATGDYEDVLIQQAIERVLDRYVFPRTLMGTELIRFALGKLYKEPKLIKCVSKGLYVVVGEAYQISAQQVERNIRYAVKKSRTIPGTNGLQSVLRFLREEVVEEVMVQYGRPN
ncbi:MAG: hypothetical protein KBT07_04660 [Clostridiales bacterium]|nr:hypothetical protein [Candidatus Scatonaster coprocaballi]